MSFARWYDEMRWRLDQHRETREHKLAPASKVPGAQVQRDMPTSAARARDTTSVVLELNHHEARALHNTAAMWAAALKDAGCDLEGIETPDGEPAALITALLALEVEMALAGVEL